GESASERIAARAPGGRRAALAALSPAAVRGTLAGEEIRQVLTAAPGDGHPIVGLKVIAEHGWFAAPPSGTEEIYKIYAESFLGASPLRRIQDDARGIVAAGVASRWATTTNSGSGL